MAKKKNTILLPDELYECPQFWINFVEATNVMSSQEGEALIDLALERDHNARMIGDLVVFETESDAIMFKLRWA